MKKILTILLLLFLVIGHSKANNPGYAVSNIPEELKEGANSVVRQHNVVFEVESAGKAIESYIYSITLLSRSASDLGMHLVSYDKFTKIKKFDGAVYDAYGKEIKKFKKSDVKDFSSISNFSLYEDNRVQVIEYTPPVYPLTIEFQVEKEYSGLLGYPDFKPLTKSKQSVQNCSLVIKVPAEVKLNYKSLYYQEEPVIDLVDGKNHFHWKAENLPAIREWETLRPDYHRQAPRVAIAPDKFEYDGYPGSLASWQSFGQWIFDLAKGRDELPETTVTKLKEITDGQSERQKINTLYKYMQQKTRYVSIQLGIGGFQPFEASLVDEVSYGDCKALSNYMRALLKAVGIKSYLTVINAGPDHQQILEDFPGFQFNHMILCVPVVQDTVWLECTDQTIPPGHLGDFTGNRYALVTNESGGNLVQTKRYNAEENAQIRKILVTIDKEGNANAEVNTRYNGYQLTNLVRLSILSPEEQKKRLYEMIDLGGLQISEFQFDLENQAENLKLTSVKYATMSGKRIFLNPNFMNKIDFEYPADDDRVCDIKVDYPFYDVDTVIYRLPAGYFTEFLPEVIEKESEFGFYKAYFEQDSDDEIRYIRMIKRNRGLYPAAKYQEFREFFNSIAEHDNVKIVLKNTT